MSYQVLARKYRPKNFDTLVGQEHVVRALTHALDTQRLHHAYLFTGTRGVGKTTLSRILAKSLNCEQGVSARPCGVCDTCTSIDAGRFIDYIEMDAASNRGVDEMAQLLEQAVYAPSHARFKVYMIDEVHMLTNHAFNAMLKTLEEPPAHIKFILATTDPQKIPMTVLSRCLQFNLKQMSPGHIVTHLTDVLHQEQIIFDTLALRLLAKGARGSMRDALSLTDQAISYAAGSVTLEAVQGMLGALDQSYLIRILDALVVQEGAVLLEIADEMTARSLSYRIALQDLATMLHQIAMVQAVPNVLPEDIVEREAIVRLAALFDPEETQLFYQIVVQGYQELGLAPDEYAGFSMTLLRLLAFRPSADTKQPVDQTRLSNRTSGGVPAVTSATVLVKPEVSVGGVKTVSAPVPVTKNLARAALDAARIQTGSVPEPQKTERGYESSERTPDTKSTDLPKKKIEWDGNWPTLAASLALRGVVQQLAQQSELLSYEDQSDHVSVHLRVPLETLLSANSVPKLTAALQERFGTAVRIQTTIGAVAQTANSVAVAEQIRRQQEAETLIQNDLFVQGLMHDFGATLVPGSVQPIDSIAGSEE